MDSLSPRFDSYSDRAPRRPKKEAHELQGPVGIQVGYTLEVIDVNTFGEVMIYDGPVGGESPTGEVINAYNGFGTLPPTSRVLFQWIGRGYQIITGNPCP
jgi:hypothetical protein